MQKTVIKKRGTDKGFNSEGWKDFWKGTSNFLCVRMMPLLFQEQLLLLTIAWDKQLWKSAVFWTAPVKYTTWMRVGSPWTTSLQRLLHTKWQKIHCHILGNKAQITILTCANAAGTTLPLIVIFDRQCFNPEWSKGKYLTCFMECSKNRPRTLFLLNDATLCQAHSSHPTSDAAHWWPLFILWARENTSSSRDCDVLSFPSFNSRGTTAWC